MFEKSLEFWAVIIGMVFYIASRRAEDEPIRLHVVKAIAAGFLAVGLATEVAPYVRDSEAIAAVIIMAFGQLILDVGTALVSDRDLVKEIVKRRFGGGKDE